MTGMSIRPHRKRNPRQCDRCRQRALWIIHRPGRRDEYACDAHVPKQ